MRILLLLSVFFVSQSSYADTCDVSREQLVELAKIASCGTSDDTFKCLESNGINLTRENKLPGSIGSALGAQASRKAFVEVSMTKAREKENKKTKTGFFDWFQSFFFSYAVAEYNDNLARGAIGSYAAAVERGIVRQRTEATTQIKRIHEAAYSLRLADAQQVEVLADQKRVEQVKAYLTQLKKDQPHKADRIYRVDEALDNALKAGSSNIEDRRMAWSAVAGEINSNLDADFEYSPLRDSLRVKPVTQAPADPVKDMQFLRDRYSQAEKKLVELDSQRNRVSGDQYLKTKKVLEEEKRIFGGLVQGEEIETKRLAHVESTQRYNRGFLGGGDPSDRSKTMAYFGATDGFTREPMALWHRDEYITHRFPKTNNWPDSAYAQDQVRKGRGLIELHYDAQRKHKQDALGELLEELAKKTLKVGTKVVSYVSTGPVGAAMAAEDMAETMYGIIQTDISCGHSEAVKYITYQKCKPVADILNPKMRNFLNLGDVEFQKELMESHPMLCEQMKNAVKLYMPTQWNLKCNDRHDGFIATLPDRGISEEVKLNKDGSIRKVILTQDKGVEDRVGGAVGIDRDLIDGGRTSFVMDNGKPQSLCVSEDAFFKSALNSATKKVATWVEGKNPDDMGCHPSYNQNISMKDVDREGQFFPEQDTKNGEKSLNFFRVHMFAAMEMSQCCGPNRDSANADRCLAYENHGGNKVKKKLAPERPANPAGSGKTI